MERIVQEIRLLAHMVLLVWASAHASPSFAENAEPQNYLDHIPTMMCDATNQSWVLRNKHTFLSIQIDVRWHPEGGKARSEAFVLAPGQERPVGCAPILEIVSAKFMNF